MSKFAATITIPVTNANMQEKSTRSITSLVVRSPIARRLAASSL
jgi:hypothetical protein